MVTPAHRNWRGFGGFDHCGYGDHELLAHGDTVAVAAIAVSAVRQLGAVVGEGGTFRPGTILLFTRDAGSAQLAAVDHVADANRVANCEFRYAIADPGDGADDFVTRNARPDRVLPIISALVDVGMADPAECDVDLDLASLKRLAAEADWLKLLLRAKCAIADHRHRSSFCCSD